MESPLHYCKFPMDCGRATVPAIGLGSSIHEGKFVTFIIGHCIIVELLQFYGMAIQIATI